MMDYTRSTSGTGEDNTGIPDDLRCKRSDGKQWRCTAMSMPDKTVCEKHYIQAKKRAANSALRASMKKAKRKSLGESDIYLESKSDDMDLHVVSPEAEDYPVSISGKKYKEKLPKTQVGYSPETPSVRKSYQKLSNDGQQRDVTQYEESMRSYKTTPPSGRESSRSRSHKIDDDDDSATTDILEGNSDSSDGNGGQTCHQCRRNDRDGVAWCLLCDRRGYCDSCISTWYSALSLEEIQSVCPACRGICNCRACLRGDNFIKVKIREIPVQEKMEYLYCLLGSVLPVVKRIHHDQYSEVEIERRLRGNEIDLARTKLNVDEQMCCDACRTPVIDYHRHCMNCSYDVCLSCCQDLRQNLSKFSDWKADSDGNIPCPPKEHGGCGCSLLTLKRIFKMNWVARLVKNVEEMVSGCKTYDAGSQQKTGSNFRLCQFAHRENVDDNFLYCPSSQDVNTEGIGDFRKHWIRGEPVIVKEVCDVSSMSSWDPMVIWRGIRETAEEKLKDDNRIVKALDCLDWSEVEIELGQFIKGYSEGRIHENGWPEMLKLKNWPSPTSLEEFLLYQRPEFINKLPLLEYIHSKWGLLNVAAKLPNYSLQNDAGPKIIISYGTYEELRRGNSVNNLCFSMRDTVHLLVHTCKVKLEGLQRAKIQKVQKAYEESLRDPKIGINSIKDELVDDEGIITNYTVEEKTDNCASGDAFEENCPGALWDVFRREDVPKLIEYFRVYWKEFGMPENWTNDSAPRPLYDGLIFLNSHHKRKLKEEFRAEPWSFEQHLGQAVFIPAGCPFQVRNLQSTVQLGLDFLSPESLGEAVRLAEEIRGLPNDHDAKVQMLEVGKISLYAASSAIKEVQKLVLDTKLGVELGFEDPNLTAFVLDNLEKMVKRRQISCTS